MTEDQIEKDSDECWALWRRMMTEAGHNVARFSEIQVWNHAYRAGVELGIEIGREACATEAHKLVTDVMVLFKKANEPETTLETTTA